MPANKITRGGLHHDDNTLHEIHIRRNIQHIHHVYRTFVGILLCYAICSFLLDQFAKVLNTFVQVHCVLVQRIVFLHQHLYKLFKNKFDQLGFQQVVGCISQWRMVNLVIFTIFGLQALNIVLFNYAKSQSEKLSNQQLNFIFNEPAAYSTKLRNICISQ